MSNPDTTAPSRRAVAIACRPATPAPITSTLAGATVPAAVISMGKNFGSRSAASSTALYPPTVLCEDKASIDCARVMRGIDSIAKPTIAALGQTFDPLLVRQWLEEGDQRHALRHRRHLVGGRLAHADDDVGARIQLGAGSNRGACLAVGLVREPGALAGARFDGDLEPGTGQARDRVGHERDAPLACGRLLGNRDLHRAEL